VNNPPAGDDWIALSSDALAVGAVHDWAVVPRCGGVVVFTGTVRDFADGRAGVQGLGYEAYAEHVVPRLEAIALEARSRWSELGRIALVHRVGELTLTEVTPAAFSCPCHGGAYDTEGNRTAGPPVRALDRFEFKIEGGRLILGHAYSVGEVRGEAAQARIKRYSHAGPGIHVDGLSSWLYPIQPGDVAS